MLQHNQTITEFNVDEGQRGNCWSTAIACMLDLEVSGVPHFVQLDEDGEGDWYLLTKEWLNTRGFTIKQITRNEIPVDQLYLVTGLSPRTSGTTTLYHVVIYKNHQMVHDPHPSRAGLLAESDFYVIEKLNHSSNRDGTHS